MTLDKITQLIAEELRRGLPGVPVYTQTDDTFTCDACGGNFPKGWSDDEAATEAGVFAPSELVDAAVVCGDCWQEMRRQMPDLDERYPEVTQ